MSINEPGNSEPRVTSPIFGLARHQLRSSLVRSPAHSEGQDSDATEDGIIAPVAIGNQQRLLFASEGQESDEGNAQVNLGLDLRAAPDSVSSDAPDNFIRPSVIFLRGNSSNLQGGTDESETTSPVLQNVEEEEELIEDVILAPASPQIGHENDAFMEDEAVQNESPQPVPSPSIISNEEIVAGPSREASSEGRSIQEEGIIPVVINYPIIDLSPDHPVPANQHDSSHNDEGTSGERAQAEPVAQSEQNVAPTSSSSEPADQQRRDDGVPPCKRQRLSEDSPVSKKEAPPNLDDDEDDGLTCSICLDHWTSSGEHRLVCLKCGHMFGFSCIERWIKSQKASERKCPTCKTKAKLADLRNLYGYKIQMVDTTELEELRGKKKELEREKDDLVREVGYMRKMNDDLTVKHREALVEIQKLKSEKMVSAQRPKRHSEVPQVRYRASIVHTLELSKNEGCRVLAFNEARCIIAASLPTPTNLFKEYALKLIDAETFRPRQTMPSHSRMIRDVAFSNDGKMLLSCSLDKTAHVLCMDSTSPIATFQCDMPVWSVCWDADNPWVLFTGAQNGVVRQFDVRSPGQEISRIVTEGNPTPVASLAGIPKDSGLGWAQGGLISCRFRQLYPYERTSIDTFEAHPCSIEGPFTSLRYERRTEHVLVSTRPTDKSPRAQHLLFQMSSLGKVPQYNLVQNFFGSATLGVISRSCIMPIFNPQGDVEDMLVSSYVESDSHIGLWSCSIGQKLQSIPSSEIVMDLCPIYANGKNYLSTLSDRKLRLYKIEKS